MIEQAERLNQDGDRVSYHLNERSDLTLFDDDSFDLVFTELVLQHMHPRYATRYILEFVRVVRPGGAVYFQVPGELQPLAAMPDDAYRANIEILSMTPEHPVARGSLAISARVRNESGVDWPATADIKLGNHWKTSDGETVVLDDGRTWLAGDLASGESVDVALHCTVPDAPGAMVLELDLVHEYVAWFEDRTGEVLRRTIEIAPAVATPSPGDAEDDPAGDGFAPRMEIYGMPAPFVRALLELAGARVLDVLPDHQVGGRWPSFAYIATKE